MFLDFYPIVQNVNVCLLPLEYLSALKPFKNEVPQGHHSFQVCDQQWLICKRLQLTPMDDGCIPIVSVSFLCSLCPMPSPPRTLWAIPWCIKQPSIRLQERPSITMTYQLSRENSLSTWWPAPERMPRSCESMLVGHYLTVFGLAIQTSTIGSLW